MQIIFQIIETGELVEKHKVGNFIYYYGVYLTDVVWPRWHTINTLNWYYIGSGPLTINSPSQLISIYDLKMV